MLTHKVRDQILPDLKLNGTVIFSITFAGSVSRKGNCNLKGTFRDQLGYWENVGKVVTGYVQITLQDYYAAVNLNTDEFILRSGTTCKFSDTKCIDIEAGYAFWYPIPQTSCENNKYVELYSGYVDKLEEEGRYPIFALKTGDVTFAFSAVSTVPACSAVLIRTEPP